MGSQPGSGTEASALCIQFPLEGGLRRVYLGGRSTGGLANSFRRVHPEWPASQLFCTAGAVHVVRDRSCRATAGTATWWASQLVLAIKVPAT